MANKKISDLPAAGAAVATDLVETEQGGTSKKETLTQVFALGKAITTGKVPQGLLFGVNHAASHSGLLTVILDLEGSAGSAVVQLFINGVLQYNIAESPVNENVVLMYYVNAGDIIRVVNFLDPAGVNTLEDNYILPLTLST